jgi:hypothetical protein
MLTVPLVLPIVIIGTAECLGTHAKPASWLPFFPPFTRMILRYCRDAIANVMEMVQVIKGTFYFVGMVALGIYGLLLCQR